ncbi:protein E31 [Elephant endotheliotropic herpesvirus 5B]|nr:protein E31 [Elephant endotheliotropic herpesvirus 5B]
MAAYKVLFIISYILSFSYYMCDQDTDECSIWDEMKFETFNELRSRKKRSVLQSGGSCDMSFLSNLSGGIGKRDTDSHSRCLETHIMKCFYYVDYEHFFDNTTHLIGNITVNLNYTGKESNLAFNVSHMHIPLLHSDKVTEKHFTDRNNKWPWCTPKVPGKELEILWNDSFIPFELLNKPTIYITAFGFEFLDGNNVTELLTKEG